ncbi:MAG: acetate--CoA ligase family protein [Marinovum sp.]|nr:acetate--CoA ligase family protein [Marinovum sp.]
MTLDRLLRPKSIAVVGGGIWCASVVHELEKIGFGGSVWRVHPRHEFATVGDLPEAPDAAFIGINGAATIDVVRALRDKGAGGATCFASGFAEAAAELDGAADLQAQLLEAAGHMPILGPNCYGVLNYLDRVAIWPDQHGGVPRDTGVAVLTQSSNIAINLTMQARGVPLAYAVTVGNQAQQDMSEIASALLDDLRVTAIGLHIEGIDDVSAFHRLALKARGLGKAIVALKIGSSEQAQAATVSHTASLAGSMAGADALMARFGVAQVRTLEALLEALKIAHVHGTLPHAGVASMSCSGGEASLMADLGALHGVHFPPLLPDQSQALRNALGPRVALANPLDYHTYIWGDEAAMTASYAAMMTEDHAMGLLVIDTPRGDRCSAEAWEPSFRALATAQAQSGRPMAALASLAETMPEALAERLMGQGIVPLVGLSAALEAISALAISAQDSTLPAAPRQAGEAVIVAEAEAKFRLAEFGLAVPSSQVVAPEQAANVAEAIGFPVVVKSLGEAHKSDSGGVRLNLLSCAAVSEAAHDVGTAEVLIEQMLPSPVAELLVGVVSDPVHGLVLTLGRGGVETELWGDVTHALLPVSGEDVAQMLGRLKMAPLLNGYRGRPMADKDAIVLAVLAVQDFVLADTRVQEVEINPLLCFEQGAVAVDALIREDMA